MAMSGESGRQVTAGVTWHVISRRDVRWRHPRYAPSGLPFNPLYTTLHTLHPPPFHGTRADIAIMPEVYDVAHSHARLFKSLETAADKYPKPEKLVFSYGTAGFRTL